ncbi:M949_RS01915 family surface polysaccharide biosynthesis protein [Lacibacter luteus]|uniref:M949_RS01915 family surface polysaccharide biosynthesis protein n=1 Tax=Lacibacter luteus TaxID=2508719 RepID=UPI002695E772
MRHLFILIIALNYWTDAFAQKATLPSEILTSKQVTELFPDTVRKTLNINFPIFRVYKYSDKAGQYYCILSESRNVISVDKDTFSHNIKAINVKADNGSFIKLWEINDNIIKNNNDESSIWFWTKYIDFKDYDNDGLADPFIIYGTSAANGYDDARIKFIIYYRGQKIAIRHQNGVLDFERETMVDKLFYDLPQSLQTSTKQKMELMIKNNQAIFPAGWQTAMKNKMTIFKER